MTEIAVKSDEVLRLVLSFLHENDYIESMHCLEKESGTTIEPFDADSAFLRDLVLDGEWASLLQFIEPLQSLPNGEHALCAFEIKKQQLLETIHDKEAKYGDDFDANAALELLADLERLGGAEKVADLRRLFALSSLSRHPKYKRWRVAAARLRLFDVLARSLLRRQRRRKEGAGRRRLVSLLVRGRLYEKCTKRLEKGKGEEELDIGEIRLFDDDDGDDDDDDDDDRLVDVHLPRWISHLKNVHGYKAEPRQIKESTNRREAEEMTRLPTGRRNVMSLSCTVDGGWMNGNDADREELMLSLPRPTTPRQLRSLFHRRPSRTMPSFPASVTERNEPEPLRPCIESSRCSGISSSTDVTVTTTTTTTTTTTPRYQRMFSIADVQAIRAVAFSNCGSLFGLGSNSSTLRVCASHHFDSATSPSAT